MNLSSMDLNLLLILEATLQERNVTHAARRVGLSQPATSSALRRLRDFLRDPLLVRSGRHMLLTARGEELLPVIANALDQLRRVMDAEPIFNPATSTRIFNLLANDYVEMLLFPRLIQSLEQSAKAVQLHLGRMDTLFQPPVEQLASGNADLAIGFIPNSPSPQPSLTTEVLWVEQNVAIARRKHPRIRRTLSRSDFLRERHAAVFYQKSPSGLIDSVLQRDRSRRKLVAILPHFTSVCRTVAESDLIATVPARLARALSRQLGLQVLPCPVHLPEFQLSMVWHSRHESDPAHKWLRNAIVKASAGV